MSKQLFLLGILVCCLVSVCSGQTSAQIQAIQYYFNTDPGVGVAGNGAIVPVTPAVTIDENISVTFPGTLPEGFNYMFVRVKDEFGRWSLHDAKSFYVLSTSTASNDIEAIEYYIDTDPGVGNGTQVAVTPTNNLNHTFPFTLPAGLNEGFHYFFVRVKGSDGQWSLHDAKSFYVLSTSTASNDIEAIEYYIDTDPGVGNGTQVAVTPTNNLNHTFPFTLPAGLNEGFHYFFVRVKGSDGQWSLHDAKSFYVLSTSTASNDIEAIEYYIDTDPGVGNGTQVAVTPTNNLNHSFPFTIPAGLNEGFHNFFVRVKGSDGQWSLHDAKSMYVVGPSAVSTSITELEYYFDNDPGVGLANPIPITTTPSVSSIFQIDVPCLSTGDHYMFLRAKDEYGRWSLIDHDTLEVTAGVPTASVTPAGPLTICAGSAVSLSFDSVGGVSYQWLKDGSDIVGETSKSYDVTSAGNYSVRSTCGGSFTTSNVVNVSVQATSTYYADSDNDGYGDPATTINDCSPPTGYVIDNTDCDDSNPNINPGEAEACNGIDDNCDGNIDEGVQTTYYADNDNDTYGDPGNSLEACSQPTGYVTDNSDCDDADANVNPGATEICNGIDDNCDGNIDEGVLTTFYADTDGDSYGDPGNSLDGCSLPVGYVLDNTDCDDTDVNVNPGATEICNGIDDNCDGNIDEGVQSTFYADTDGDGFGDASSTTLACSAPTGFVTDNTDCDDTDANVNPAATEVCNGIDDDCDGLIDDADPSLSGQPTWYADNDNDGFGDPSNSQTQCVQPTGFIADNTDCDDNDPDEFPGQTWYIDADGDGYGTGASTVQCNRPANGYLASELTATEGDCDDSNANINPSAQYITYSGNTNFTSSLIDPQSGSPYSTFNFEATYFDATNALPPGSFPRVIMDFEGNGVFNNSNDRTLYMSEVDANDVNTNDGKTYEASISPLPTGTNWESRIRINNSGCITEFGPFNYPDVLVAPDLQIFANDITFSDENPPPSSPITVYATIHNVSGFTAQNFVVHLENQAEPSTVYPDVTVSSLSPNSQVTVSWNITTPATAGWNPMQVSVDYTDVISETNESDNSAIRAFTNGDYDVPGNIVVTANPSPAIATINPFGQVRIFGDANYIGTAVTLTDPSVAGASVTITVVETGAAYSTVTNSNGYYSKYIGTPQFEDTFTVIVEVTDFTLEGDTSTTFETVFPPCLPDLYTTITVSSNSIIEGQSITGNIKVTNIGCDDAATSLLDISQSGGSPIVPDATIPFLTPGAFQDFPLSTITFNTPGTYTVCGFADKDQIIDESNESNNSRCQIITVHPALPDIFPSSGPSGLIFECEGRANHPVSFVIANGGGSATGPFNCEVVLKTNGVVTNTYTKAITDIPAFGTTSFSISFIPSTANQYTFEVKCDIPLPNGNVVEYDETNNEATYLLNVGDCKPDLSLTNCGEAIEVLPVDPPSSGTITIEAEIANSGTDIAFAPIDVEMKLSSGATYNLVYNSNLSPGDKGKVSVAVPASTPGTDTVKVTVDPADVIDEFSETNNFGSGILCHDFETVPKCGSNFFNPGFTYIVNQSIYLDVGMRARHLYDASSVTVRFEVSGPGLTGTVNLGDAVINNVDETCVCPYVATLPTNFVFPQAGVYTFTMTSDPDNVYLECDETNNVLSVDVNVVNTPDMRILSQYIAPSKLNPDVGENISIDVTYENIGVSNTSDQMRLDVLVDEVLLESVYPVAGLINGDNNTINISAPWSSTINGAHIIRAIIDADEVISESKELNNEATRAVIVGAAANLFFQSLTASDPVPLIGDTITVDAIVENEGDVPCDADVVFFYVDDNLNEVQIAGPIPVNVTDNSTSTVQFDWEVLDNSTDIIARIINSSPTEFDYEDNEATTPLGIFDVGVSVTQSCNGGSDGTATANVTGGNPPFAYLWNTGYNDQTLNAAAGTYTVTVTDNTGQTASGVGTINDNPGVVYYADTDGDSYGDNNNTIVSCTGVPTGYVADNTDCDDTDANVNPGATEVCNGIDDDCDGLIDDADPSVVGQSTWYADTDGDTYGDASTSQQACFQPTGYVADNTDCDDTDANVNPGATEVCNGIDDDCDGLVDDADPSVVGQSTWYADTDGDTYGDPSTSQQACFQPSGYVADNTDCDDTDANVNPGATEVCNGIDDDCDGLIDDADPSVVGQSTWYADTDGDTYGDPSMSQQACFQPTGYVADNTDCDDTDANVNPGVTEVCNGIDDDCDGLVDDADPSVVGQSTWYADTDGDTYGDPSTSQQACFQPTGYVADNTDCDDTDANVNPGANEVCNGIDDDCDGLIDDADPSVVGQSTWYADTDGDTYGDPSTSQLACFQPSGYVADNTDCDDTDANVNPGATEVCNGIDDDCDGLIDDADPSVVGQSTWYADTDGDTYGDASTSQLACFQPTGYVADNTDCDDTDANVNPGATEVCNGIDDDCDGLIDDADPSVVGQSTWYADTDGDTYGDPSKSQQACFQPTGYVADNTDCDDTDANVNPGVTEVCNGIDDDCDGLIDDADPSVVGQLTWYADSDGDTYGDPSTSQQACFQPTGYVADNTDCDDTDANVNPGVVEVCLNGIDDNCNGQIDENCNPCLGNVVPVVDSITTLSDIIPKNDSISLNIYFTDEANGGPYNITVLWDDGSYGTYSVPSGLTANYSLTVGHTYTKSAVYEPMVFVTDGCDSTSKTVSGKSTYQYIAVYVIGNQFTTMGGWFNAPAGSLMSDPSFTGKVNMGNVAKPKNGIFKGELELNINNKNLKVHKTNSSEWDYLVIENCCLAFFEGEVNVNYNPGYHIVVSQSDKSSSCHAVNNAVRIRITKISNKQVIFDTQAGASKYALPTTVLNAGAVKVHVKKACFTQKEDGAEIEESSFVKSYPNPVYDEASLKFRTANSGDYQMHLYNLHGELIEVLFDDYVDSEHEYSLQFTTDKLATGMYFAILIGEGEMISTKVIVQK